MDQLDAKIIVCASSKSFFILQYELWVVSKICVQFQSLLWLQYELCAAADAVRHLPATA